MDGSGLPEKGLGCSPALLKEFAQRRYDMSGLSGMYRTWFPHGTEQRAAHGFVYLIPPVQSNKLSKASPPALTNKLSKANNPRLHRMKALCMRQTCYLSPRICLSHSLLLRIFTSVVPRLRFMCRCTC